MYRILLVSYFLNVYTQPICPYLHCVQAEWICPYLHCVDPHWICPYLHSVPPLDPPISALCTYNPIGYRNDKIRLIHHSKAPLETTVPD